VRVFLAGATGVIGRALIPQLVERGHEVVGMTRSAAKQDIVRGLGATPVVADALDRDAVAAAVSAAEPEVVVHELTALGGPMSLRDARHPERSAAAITTGRLRTEGTDHLLAAARAAGARRVVAQSFGAFRLPDMRQPGLDAILHLEQAVTTISWGEGLALRYGGFYGPGTAISRDPSAPLAGPIRRRRLPIIGDGNGVTSHIHIDDAATATAIAVERGAPGIYDIVDDDPAPAREWLPALAAALAAKPPRRIPRWLARPLAGEMATAMMTTAKGASNAEAKRELGWTLRYPSWRQGFLEGLG
jgi:2-alkyl-3-oxoalkanoate reductase